MDTLMDMHDEKLGFFDRLRLAGGVALAVLLMSYVGWMAARPYDPLMPVTFTHSQRLLLAIWPVVLVVTVVSGGIGMIIAGRRLPEAGMLAAASGLAIMALQGGSMQTLLGYHVVPETSSRRMFMILMLVDTLLWSGLMTCTWFTLEAIGRWLSRADEDEEPGEAGRMNPAGLHRESAGLSQGWKATVVTAVVGMFVIWLTVARTPVATIARGQVVASVFFGLFLGAMAARYFVGVRQAHWYALAVPVVAVVGYLAGLLQADMSWARGPWAAYAQLPTTPPHALVRPLPVEYISLGLAGAILGMWSGRRTDADGREDGG